VQLPGGTSAPTGAIVYDDGIIARGVTADGKPNTTIVSAERYYKGVYSNSAGINEASVFDASFHQTSRGETGLHGSTGFVSKFKLQSVIFSCTEETWLSCKEKRITSILKRLSILPIPDKAWNHFNYQLQALTGFNIQIGF
jgi:hypothetical protein